DINAYYIPATQTANDEGIPRLANMIMLGKLIEITKIATIEQVRAALEKSVPPSKSSLIDTNIKAIEIGYRI
ncbi:MAG: 2-oxoacid:ferredoxin oxidoreductase subunit gamma, partial [Clostridiaceae bacterium]|nr:2-oxoacid:ferredoxin oxidoreductase subunit gamma [Clostridiaceae bacterium]